ncbi:ABC transporter permease [Ruminococcus sp.]|uniref:ABC transporter permease n=1 Tax=Ruminococcus sp. TaxID=41978 RepID=UPI0038631AC5
MRTLAFASRNAKELQRDVLTVIFGIGFPLVLLTLLSIINSSIPKEAHMTLFEIKSLTGGISAFGLVFLSLFSALLVSKDRCTAFIIRLYTSPLKPSSYIIGYILPLIPMAVAQTLVTCLFALIFGLEFSANILLAAVVSIVPAFLYISIGLLCGTAFSDKMVGILCGAVLTNLSAWLSNIWFDLSLVGGTFEKIAGFLPFVHCVNALRAVLDGDYAQIFPELLWVFAYAVVIFACAVYLFNRRMKQDK